MRHNVPRLPICFVDVGLTVVFKRVVVLARHQHTFTRPEDRYSLLREGSYDKLHWLTILPRVRRRIVTRVALASVSRKPMSVQLFTYNFLDFSCLIHSLGIITDSRPLCVSRDLFRHHPRPEARRKLPETTPRQVFYSWRFVTSVTSHSVVACCLTDTLPAASLTRPFRCARSRCPGIRSAGRCYLSPGLSPGSAGLRLASVGPLQLP